MKVRFNGLTGRFEIKEVQSNITLPPGVLHLWAEVTRTCNVTANVWDFCYESPTTAGKVEENNDNTVTYPTIGIIIQKITPTLCRVALFAEINAFAGLTQARDIFLSTSGTATNTVPTTGIVQQLGYATSPTSMVIRPQLVRTIRA